MKLLTFDELWQMADSGSIAGNSVYYHPCCDVWTTKASKAKRASHSKYLKWGKLLLTLDKSFEDKKQALHVKMIEERWRLPALLNEACQNQPAPKPSPQHTFNTPPQPAQPEHFETSVAGRGFDQPVLNLAEIVTPSGRYHII